MHRVLQLQPAPLCLVDYIQDKNRQAAKYQSSMAQVERGRETQP